MAASAPKKAKKFHGQPSVSVVSDNANDDHAQQDDIDDDERGAHVYAPPAVVGQLDRLWREDRATLEIPVSEAIVAGITAIIMWLMTGGTYGLFAIWKFMGGSSRMTALSGEGTMDGIGSSLFHRLTCRFLLRVFLGSMRESCATRFTRCFGMAALLAKL